MFKSLILNFTFVLLACSSLQAQATIEIKDIPTNISDFVDMRDELSQTPDGAAALFVVAMMMYSQDKEVGKQAFTIALDRTNLQEDPNGYMGFAPARGLNYHLNRLSDEEFQMITQSYFKGTSPESKYKLPSGNQYVETTWNKYSEQSNGDIRLFVKCTGAASPRPITVRKNNRGIWKVYNYSSYFLGVMGPPVDDRL